ncbi:MAG: GNAT family N-acetyltransferase [bacterium]
MLETRRLILRMMRPEDIDGLLKIFADPKVMKSFGVPPFNRGQMEKWVWRNIIHQQKHGYGLFTVIHKDDQVIVGDCGLEHMEVEGKQEVELGYDFRSDYWNQGLASEAARAVRDFALFTLHMPRIISLIRPDNIASRKVSEKIGMKQEQTIMRGDERYFIYSLTP